MRAAAISERLRLSAEAGITLERWKGALDFAGVSTVRHARTADEFRADSKLTSVRQWHCVVGLVFLASAERRFDANLQEVAVEAQGGAGRAADGHRLLIAMTRGRPETTRYDLHRRSVRIAVTTREDRE